MRRPRIGVDRQIVDEVLARQAGTGPWKLLDYLKRKDMERYAELIRRLGIRK